jgi:hypothetical protein
MITLALGITLYLLKATGQGVGCFLFFAMLFDFGWLSFWAVNR